MIDLKIQCDARAMSIISDVGIIVLASLLSISLDDVTSQACFLKLEDFIIIFFLPWALLQQSVSM